MDKKKVISDWVFEQFFGSVPPDPIRLRGVRLKSQLTGHLTIAHPKAKGPHIIAVQQVPTTVSDAEIIRRMDRVTLLRQNKTLHFAEIAEGAILR